MLKKLARVNAMDMALSEADPRGTLLCQYYGKNYLGNLCMSETTRSAAIERHVKVGVRNLRYLNKLNIIKTFVQK